MASARCLGYALLGLHMKQILELTKRLVGLIKLYLLDITAFKILINIHLTFLTKLYQRSLPSFWKSRNHSSNSYSCEVTRGKRILVTRSCKDLTENFQILTFIPSEMGSEEVSNCLTL